MSYKNIITKEIIPFSAQSDLKFCELIETFDQIKILIDINAAEL